MCDCLSLYMCICFHFDVLNAGRLLAALICEYLDWAQLNHTSKVYIPECNLVICDILTIFLFSSSSSFLQLVLTTLFNYPFTYLLMSQVLFFIFSKCSKRISGKLNWRNLVARMDMILTGMEKVVLYFWMSLKDS